MLIHERYHYPYPCSDRIFRTVIILNLQRTNRLSRDGSTQILLHDRRQAKAIERMLVIFTAEKWGWNDPKKTKKESLRIAKAASQQVAYDRGFKTTLAFSRLPFWRQSIDDIIDGSVPDAKNNPLDSNHAGRKKYTI